MLIDPAAGPPDSSPSLVGELTGALYWYWSNSEGSGRTDYIGKIIFGDDHCYVSLLTKQQSNITVGLVLAAVTPMPIALSTCKRQLMRCTSQIPHTQT